MKIFKSEALIKGLKIYVEEGIGTEYAQSPPASMDSMFESGDKTTPIIFVLSQGADPNDQIMNYARKKGLEGRLYVKSLGQG